MEKKTVSKEEMENTIRNYSRKGHYREDER